MKILKILVSSLFPDNCTCPVCNAETVLGKYSACQDCQTKIQTVEVQPVVSGLDGIRTGTVYNDAMRLPMSMFKYNGAAYLKNFFAQFLSLEPDWEIDLIVPVPLHRLRKRNRGYNQSEKLAVILSEKTGIKMDAKLLFRIKNTVSQTNMQNSEARKNNIAGAFYAKSSCAGKRILLVDDVLTTGSTLSECARTLKNAGADAVFAVTACARLAGEPANPDEY